MKFGTKLRQLRDKKGLSQKALGDLAGVLQNSIARYETGEQVPGFDAVQSLCLALGVPCTIFDGCEHAPAEKTPGRGRPPKAVGKPAAKPVKRNGKKGGK